MINDIHFISGLPRSGSTLLSALLRQNPKFRAGMTGPVGPLVEAMLKAMSMANETSVFIDDAQRETLLRAIFETFHGGLPARHVSFDTNRMWCAKLPLLAKLFPQAKIICCVRDVASIVNSVERLVAENMLQPSGIFSFEPGGTVYSRADGLGGGNSMIGFAYNALREAFYGPHSDRLLLVTYNTLTRDTKHALTEIYRFIGQEPFKHGLQDHRIRRGRIRPTHRHPEPARRRPRGSRTTRRRACCHRTSSANMPATTSGSTPPPTPTACRWCEPHTNCLIGPRVRRTSSTASRGLTIGSARPPVERRNRRRRHRPGHFGDLSTPHVPLGKCRMSRRGSKSWL